MQHTWQSILTSQTAHVFLWQTSDTKPAGGGGTAGDADLPGREPLHERRAKFDSARARQAARAEAEAEGAPRKRPAGEVDPTYQVDIPRISSHPTTPHLQA